MRVKIGRKRGTVIENENERKRRASKCEKIE